MISAFGVAHGEISKEAPKAHWTGAKEIKGGGRFQGQTPLRRLSRAAELAASEDPSKAARARRLLKPLGARAAIMKKDKAKHVAIASGGTAAGLVAGQAAYQGAGYGAKHVNFKVNYTKDPGQSHKRPKGMSRSKYDKLLKPAKAKHGAFTHGMYRNMPKGIPGNKINRVTGYTHGGKIGTAVGGAATIAGGALAYRATRNKEKS